MPFVANRRGETVAPEEVPDDASLTCIDCGEELRVRGSHERNGEFVARHFWHVGGGGGCSGGESEIHRRIKSIVLSKLKHVFNVADAGVERKIGENVADVYATFEKRDEKYGRGIVCEVQYRNEDKDIVSATQNYLGEEYSVCWIEPSEIDGRDVELSDPDWYYPDELKQFVQDEILEKRESDPFSEGYTCPSCLTLNLVEARGVSHVYESGRPIYECPQCGQYFIERDDGWGEGSIESVPHKGNLDFNANRRF